MKENIQRIIEAAAEDINTLHFRIAEIEENSKSSVGSLLADADNTEEELEVILTEVRNDLSHEVKHFVPWAKDMNFNTFFVDGGKY